MTDEQYIDIAIEISKNATYPYGAIIVRDGEIIGRSDDKTLMEASMYSHATLQDSNDNYCPEMITNIDELAKYAKNKIEIVKDLHRDKAAKILKERGEQ